MKMKSEKKRLNLIKKVNFAFFQWTINTLYFHPSFFTKSNSNVFVDILQETKLGTLIIELAFGTFWW